MNRGHRRLHGLRNEEVPYGKGSRRNLAGWNGFLGPGGAGSAPPCCWYSWDFSTRSISKSRTLITACPLKTGGTKAIIHCDAEIWQNPKTNLRVLGPLPRFLNAWKRLYRQRMSVERIFRSLKRSGALEGHCALGLRKIALQAILGVLTYQATVLARLKAGDVDRMRRMSVKVA